MNFPDLSECSMDWSEQGEKKQRTVLAADKRGDAFVGVCVQAVVGSQVNALFSL